MQRETKNRTRFELAPFILGSLVLAVFVSSCVCPPPPEDRVRRNIPIVWAGSPATSPPQLTDDDWRGLNTGDTVKTDIEGQGELQLLKCCGSIYVFKDSEIRVSTCTEEEKESGMATCSEAGTAGFHLDCSQRFTVYTYSAKVVIVATAFSVTYLPERELTLVIVADGAVTVQPVVDVERRTLETGVVVEAGQFVYTMPGAVSPEIAEVPARTALPLQELPLLVEPLDIQHWMDDVGLWAKEDDVLPDNWPFVAVSLISGGGPLEDPLVQQAVLTAVNKNEVTELAFPGKDVAFTASLKGQEVDAYTVPHNPDLALKLLAEAGYPRGIGLQLVYASEDEQLATMAAEMEAALESRLISVKRVEVPPAQIDEFVTQLIAEETPVLRLTRQ